MLTTEQELTTEEVAESLGVSAGTVREMCQCGSLKGRKVPNPYHPDTGAWAISPKDLRNYLTQKALPKCRLLSEPDRGYIAGLCDGEGCFTAFTTRRHHGDWWGTMYFIQIIVKEEAPIKWLKEVTGVGYVFKRDRQKQGWQDLWGWRVSCAPACEVVEQILPYLKIKRRQAEIFLQIRDVVRAGRFFRRGQNGAIPRPTEEWAARQKLIDEIHRLNQPKGKAHRKEFSSAEAT